MKLFKISTVAIGCVLCMALSACNTSGGKTIFSDEDHSLNFFTGVEDNGPLSAQVRSALRSHGQTVVEPIRVSQDSEDTVKLSGAVSNDGVIRVAERVAYQVSGVRYVVNNLSIR